MLFGKKFNRAMDWLKSRNIDKDCTGINANDENYKIKDRHEKIEKNDLLAMFISAIIVFVPVVILILGIFVLITYWFS